MPAYRADIWLYGGGKETRWFTGDRDDLDRWLEELWQAMFIKVTPSERST